MSAILSADDLNDFISPGVACIKPVESLPTAPPPPPSTDNNQSLEHEVILDGQGQAPSQGASGNAPATQISLTDCLACSGCVTSAEAVLVSLQSHSELLHALDGAPGLRIIGNDADENFRVEGLENPDSKLFVASVSPQTRASLAAAMRVAGADPASERDAGNMVAQLLMGDGGLRAGGRWHNAFTWVVDTNTARDACLVLGAEEVLNPNSDSGANKKKPTLTSSCPGWVCYAEKTHPHVLPHMSRIKSPQALMGTLLKTTLSRRLGIPPDRIWHLAVMPCFDKKLEASREELTDAAWGLPGERGNSGGGGRAVRDVDCVITSKEILMLAESRGIDFFGGLPRSPVSPTTSASFPDPALRRFLFPPRRRIRTRQAADPAAGTSGGNLHFTLQYVAARHPGATIETVRGRNVDVAEYTVKSADGTAIFRAARYYGFRNIQNLVRRLKPARPSRMPGAAAGRAVGAARRPAGGGRSAAAGTGMEYAYVEVMACPGGCTNGGGQIKVDDPVVVERRGAGAEKAKPGPHEQKQWLAQVDEAYFSAEESAAEDDVEGGEEDLSRDDGDGDDDVVGGISPSYIHDTLAHWASLTGIDIDRLTKTSFREVVSDVGKNKPSDTERVVQLAGKIGGGW